MSRSKLRPGDCITCPEADYAYGLGELYLRVTALPRGPLDRGDGWGEVRGVDIRADGSEGPERFVAVRLAAVRVLPGDAQ